MRTAAYLFVFAATGFAAELHLDSASIAANKPTALTLSLQSGENALTGVQYDVEYDASQVELKMEIGPAAEKAGKVLQSNVIQPGQQRVLIFGFNRTRLADGVVAVAHATLKGKPGANQSYPIRISQPAGTSAEGEAVPVTGTGGSLTSGSANRFATRSNAR